MEHGCLRHTRIKLVYADVMVWIGSLVPLMQAEIYLSNLQKGMILSQAIQLINSDRVDGSRPQQWADIGCGNGIFSRALLSLLHKDSIIYAIDKQPASFKEEGIKYIQQDFEKEPLSLPPLDGLIMANSLHFVKNKPAFLQNIRKHLVPGGIFILVEYDTDVSNRYVPWPISFDSAAALFKQAGFEQFEKINERPSIFNRAMMYGAHCIIPNS